MLKLANPRLNVKIIFLLPVLLLLFVQLAAANPSWSEWEKSNSLSKHGHWLVIRQPNEGFCYIKQSYDGQNKKMELSIKKDHIPHLVTPFYRGVQGDVTYWVDDGPVRIVKEENVSNFGIELQKQIFPELKKGQKLHVRVNPVGDGTMEQVFDLTGFTAASKWLGCEKCQKKVKDKHSY